MNSKPEILQGVLLDDEYSLSLDELCRVTAVQTDWLIMLVDEGIIEPATGDEASTWCFNVSSLRRVRTVLHLQQDLGVNIAGAALTLELLEEIDRLRDRLQTFEKNK